MSLIIMKLKPVFLIGIFVLIFSAFYIIKQGSIFTVKAGNSMLSNQNILVPTGEAKFFSLKNRDSTIIHNTTTTADNPDKIVWIPGDKAQIEQVTSWLASRGWYDMSIGSQDDYKTYSKDTLEQLAENGDIKALQILAKNAGSSESIILLSKAAVYGSVFALSDLANTVIAFDQLDATAPEIEKKKVMIEAAAYGVVAARRGDFEPTPVSQIEYLERRYNVKLNEMDQLAISKRSDEIYSQLESQRIALGLGKFDNTIPPTVQAFYRYIGKIQ